MTMTVLLISYFGSGSKNKVGLKRYFRFETVGWLKSALVAGRVRLCSVAKRIGLVCALVHSRPRAIDCLVCDTSAVRRSVCFKVLLSEVGRV
jgi:hypothetical protein